MSAGKKRNYRSSYKKGKIRRSLMSKASDRDVETLPLRVALHREQSGREIERNESIRRTKP